MLRKIRRDNEWTLDYVCLKAGVDHATLSLVERRLKKPSENVSRRLEKFFKRPVAELLSDPEVAA